MISALLQIRLETFPSSSGPQPQTPKYAKSDLIESSNPPFPSQTLLSCDVRRGYQKCLLWKSFTVASLLPLQRKSPGNRLVIPVEAVMWWVQTWARGTISGLHFLGAIRFSYRLSWVLLPGKHYAVYNCSKATCLYDCITDSHHVICMEDSPPRVLPPCTRCW